MTPIRAVGQPKRLTMSERNERPSGWSPDGKSILYVSDQDGSYDLFIQDVVTGESQKLLQDRNSQTWPSFMRQGYDVLCLSGRGDKDLAEVLEKTGG